MSKAVKALQMEFLRRQFAGIEDLVVGNVVGMDSKESFELRKTLRAKNIQIEVVQNNLARKVLEEKGLSRLDGLFQGCSAVIWGGVGAVELARELTEIAKKSKKLELKGVCLSGETLVGPTEVERVSKLPSRIELIGQIVATFTGPASQIVSLATSPGSQVASQIKQVAEKEGAAAA
jgi:large subunit ribosomal protein L10